MKILHINCNYAGTALHRIMLQHLSASDIDNSVFIPVKIQKEESQFDIEKNEILAPCFKSWHRAFYFLKQSEIQKALLENFRNIKDYDFLHAYTLFTDGNAAYTLHKKYNIPYFVAVRDTDVNAFFRFRPYLCPLGVKIMLSASAVFFLSRPYMEQVLDKYVPHKYRAEIAKKSFIVPNGIDDFWLFNKNLSRDYEETERRIKQKKLNVICVGRINKRKNIPVVQKALDILRRRGWNVNLTVVGKVENDKEFSVITADKHTSCLPPVCKEKLIEYYRKADVFILASHTETFGLVYAEAMSQGLPVVYTRGQGFDGQFPDGEVGYPVSDNDAVEIADAVEEICKNYTGVSKNAVKCSEKFRWGDICEKYRKMYWKCRSKQNSI